MDLKFGQHDPNEQLVSYMQYEKVAPLSSLIIHDFVRNYDLHSATIPDEP